MTTPTAPNPTPFISTPAETAIAYFEAIIHRDHVTLIGRFKWTLDECQELDTDAQTFAASKLLAAGNIINRKAMTPAAVAKASEPPADKAPMTRPTFVRAVPGSKFANAS